MVVSFTGAKCVNRCTKLFDCGEKLVLSRAKPSNKSAKVIISRQALQALRGGLPEFPEQRYLRDAACVAATKRLSRVAGALERAVEIEPLADVIGRVLRGVSLHRELLAGRGLWLVEAAETVAVAFEPGKDDVRPKVAVLVCWSIHDLFSCVNCLQQ